MSEPSEMVSFFIFLGVFMVAAGEVLYTKRKHGSLPLKVLSSGFLLGEKKFDTEKSLFEDLYGKRTSMTIKRYFPSKASQPSVDLFQELYEECRIKKGIDLENRSHEVRKLFYAGFGARCIASGYSPEDVLQEIYKGLIARNNGICPFDPRKSSFGHYVHMVCGCIMANYHRKMKKRMEREQVGIYNWDSDEYGLQDVSAYAVEVDETTPEEECLKNEAQDSLFGYIRDYDPELIIILEGLIRKDTRKMMAEQTGWSSNSVTQAVKKVRELTLEWSEGY
jgi:hypothetical protein